MSFLLSLLKKGGELELRTNQMAYHEEFKEKIKRFAFLQIKKDEKISDFSKAQSLFEKKYLEKGEDCYILRYRKFL